MKKFLLALLLPFALGVNANAQNVDENEALRKTVLEYLKTTDIKKALLFEDGYENYSLKQRQQRSDSTAPGIAFCSLNPASLEFFIDSVRIRGKAERRADVDFSFTCNGKYRKHSFHNGAWVQRNGQWKFSPKKEGVEQKALDFAILSFVDENFEEAIKHIVGYDDWKSSPTKRKSMEELLGNNNDSWRKQNEQCDAFESAYLDSKKQPEWSQIDGLVVHTILECSSGVEIPVPISFVGDSVSILTPEETTARTAVAQRALAYFQTFRTVKNPTEELIQYNDGFESYTPEQKEKAISLVRREKAIYSREHMENQACPCVDEKCGIASELIERINIEESGIAHVELRYLCNSGEKSKFFARKYMQMSLIKKGDNWLVGHVFGRYVDF